MDSSSPQLRRDGFALISVLVLLALLLVLVVGLFAIANSDVKVAGHRERHIEARGNAQAALEMALARLQEEMGPDRRINAGGGLQDSDPATALQEDVQSPWMTGSWDSWKWDPATPAPNYPQEQGNQFRRWLVSHEDETRLTDPLFPQTGITGTAEVDYIEMVSETTLGPTGVTSTTDPIESVRAGLLERASTSAGATTTPGRMAWVCLDEGSKARLNLPGVEDFETVAPSVGEQRQRFSSAPRAGVETVEEFASFSPDLNERERVYTNASVELAGGTLSSGAPLLGQQPWFHDLTTWSVGLQVDVAEGGLKKDLSRAIGDATLAPDFVGQHLVPPTPDHHGVSFEYLHAYANLWSSTSGPDHQIDAIPLTVSPATTQARETAIPDQAADKPGDGDVYPVLPVVARIQFALSYMGRRHGGYWNNGFWQPGHTGYNREQYEDLVWLYIDPVITLWNPYNVPISFEEFRVTAGQLPITIDWLVDQESIYQQPTHFLQHWYTGANDGFGQFAGGLREKTYNMIVAPAGGATEVVLQPGQAKVFSPTHRSVGDWNNVDASFGTRSTQAVNLVEGLIPHQTSGGFYLDWLAPRQDRGTPGDPPQCWGVLFLNPKNEHPDAGQAQTVSCHVHADETRPYPRAGAGDQYDFMARFQVRKSGQLYEAGGMKIDYEGNLAKVLIEEDEYPNGYLEGGGIHIQEQLMDNNNRNRKFPFALFTAQLRTEQDSRFPVRMWDHNNPLTLLSETPSAQMEHPAGHLYELNLRAFSSWASVPTIETNLGGEGYIGPNEFSWGDGISRATMAEIPIGPLGSVTDLTHANLSHDPDSARFHGAVGNSRAHSHVAPNAVETSGNRDMRYLLNDALFDQYYFSGFTEEPFDLFGVGNDRSTSDVITEFFGSSGAPPEPVGDRRLSPRQGGQAIADLQTELEGPDGYKHAAAHQVVEGMFNVNSTSVDAWKAVLSGLRNMPVNRLQPDASGVANELDDSTGVTGTPVSRLDLPNREPLEMAAMSGGYPEIYSKWQGSRVLDDTQIETLAEAIVEQVKERGPFLSLSHFVNREIGPPSERSVEGALAAAIEKSGINQSLFAVSGTPIDPAAYVINEPLAFPMAAEGISSMGAPTYISQVDLLAPIANAISVRSDTFRIRAYGDVTDRAGNVVSRAWCEAIVQRGLDYVDPSDPPETEYALLKPINKDLGRRFRVVQFRWLSPEEL